MSSSSSIHVQCASRTNTPPMHHTASFNLYPSLDKFGKKSSWISSPTFQMPITKQWFGLQWTAWASLHISSLYHQTSLQFPLPTPLFLKFTAYMTISPNQCLSSGIQQTLQTLLWPFSHHQAYWPRCLRTGPPWFCTNSSSFSHLLAQALEILIKVVSWCKWNMPSRTLNVGENKK